MESTSTKVGHGLAKVLGIKLEKPEPYEDEVTRGESILSRDTTDTFVEQPPTTAEFLISLIPSLQDVGRYVMSLFPFLSWIGRYNTQWLVGDLVAGQYLCTHGVLFGLVDGTTA